MTAGGGGGRTGGRLRQNLQGPHLGAPRQDEVPGLADKHATILHQLLAVQEGEAPEEVPDLPLPALPRDTGVKPWAAPERGRDPPLSREDPGGCWEGSPGGW